MLGKVRLVLLVMTCMCTQRAFAVDEVFYNSLVRTALVQNAVLEVADTFPTNQVVPGSMSVKDIIWFSVDEEYGVKPLVIKDYVVTLSIAKYDSLNNLVSTEAGVQLTVRFDPTEGASYRFGNLYKFSGFYRLKITVTSVAVVGGGPFPTFLKLESKLIVSRKYTFSCTASPVLDSLRLDTTSNSIGVGWAKQFGAEEYDLEWSFYDTLSPSIGKAAIPTSDFGYLFQNNATRVTTSKTAYPIPLTYPGGVLYVRVRGVQYLNGNRITGKWTSLKTPNSSLDPVRERYIVPWHERKLNWQMQATFAEEGKKSQKINYFDGAMYNRQTVSRSDATGVISAAENLYDNQGRPTISVMPAPVAYTNYSAGSSGKWAGRIGYQKYFSVAQGNLSSYSAADFDNFATCPPGGINPAKMMDTTRSAVGRYFSANNPWRERLMHKFIPSSGGFPFSMVEYMPDYTGRIRRQSGVGPSLQLGSGHESKFYYGTPDQTELDRLFGVEVGYASHYQKNMSIDPNGQITVSYIDPHGKTIATALSGDVPSNLTQLDNFVASGIVAKDLLKNVRETAKLTSNTTLLVTKSGNHDFSYAYGPPLEFQTTDCLSSTKCYDCLYDVDISVTDECGVNKVNYQYHNATYNTLCGLPDTLKATFLAINLPVGQYQVSKTLRINQDALNAYVKDYIQNLSCVPTKAALATAMLGDTSCDQTCQQCRNRLGTRTQYRSQYLAGIPTPWSVKDIALADSLYNKDVRECNDICDKSMPSECKVMYEMMLSDVTPGGQYGAYGSQLVGTDNTYVYMESTDKSSIFYKASGAPSYPYQNTAVMGAYLDDSGKKDTIWYPNGTYKLPEQLGINEYINNFKTSWLKSLVKLHPEYCSYLCCKSYSNTAFDSLLTATTTYSGAITANPPLWPLTTLLGNDPFFQSNPSLKDSLLLYWNQYAHSSGTGCSATYSLTTILTSIVYCNGQLPCNISPGSGCASDNNIFWQLAVSQYLTMRMRLKALKMQSAACPQTGYTCQSQSQLQFGVQTVGGQPNPYWKKSSRILTPPPATPSSLVSSQLQMMLDSISNTVTRDCDSVCIGNAEGWLTRLSQTCTVISTATTAQINSLRSRFIALCKAGCDFNHPNGSITPGGGNVASSFGDRSLAQAIKAVFGASIDTCNAGCSGKIIDYPGTYNAAAFAVPRAVIQAKDSCVCARYNFLQNCANLTSQDLLTYINSTSDVKLTAGQLNDISNGCTGACLFLNNTINIPPILECGVCKDWNQVNAAFTAYNTTACIMGTIGTDVNKQNQMAGHLNQTLGLNRTYAEYVAFLGGGGQPVNAQCKFLCPTSKTPNFPLDTSCISEGLHASVETMASLAYNNIIDSLSKAFVAKYLAKCFGPTLKEYWTVNAPQGEYQYTLYYYDQAGNLVKTIPPRGVNPLTNPTDLANVIKYRNTQTGTAPYPQHNFVTRYWYNTLNQLVRDSTPDHDGTDYWFDRLGRIVLSRNALQRTANDYSYIRYDNLGRSIEHGKVHRNAGGASFTVGQILDYATFETWLSNAYSVRKEVTRTYYDDVIPNIGLTQLPLYFGASGQENLRNRISSVTYEDLYDNIDTTYNYATHYSYDIGGQVKKIIQDFPELRTIKQRYKRLEYDYDLISGKVNYVWYQRDSLDQNIHHYVYDADNRLDFLETSRTGLLWERDVDHDYYLHGPLARMELGERRVQGLDYAYTLQGWLKGVNASMPKDTTSFNPTPLMRDMGHDGNYGSTGDYAKNKAVARDAFGFTLGYYAGDYSSITPTTGMGFEMSYSGTPFGNGSPGLYNGNVRHAVYTISKINEWGSKQIGSPTTPRPEGFAYKYDQLNRLVQMRAYNNANSYTSTPGTYSWQSTGSALTILGENVKYDPNGNIESYVRAGNNGGNPLMDRLDYKYLMDSTPTVYRNRLWYVVDTVTNTALYNNDLENQSPSNYGYDPIGNLTKDIRDSILLIRWTNNQKIDSIQKQDRWMKYRYDPFQNRVVKSVKWNSQTQVKRTYYVRDGQGNVMATYDAWVKYVGPPTQVQWDSFRLSELYLYGNKRLGAYQTSERMYPNGLTNFNNPAASSNTALMEGRKRYELNNHLGNVMSVVTDRKRGLTTSSDIQWFEADVLSAQQYYPFGMLMPGLQYTNNGYDYRYGFNGKEGDDEVKGDDNQQDYGMRIYDPRLGRFLSVDPLTKKYPWYTPYQFAGNMPIWAVDLDGLEPSITGTKDGQYEIAPENGTSNLFGWLWVSENSVWKKGSSTSFKKGDAHVNHADDDLSKTYYPNESVNALFCGNSETCHLYTFMASFNAGINVGLTNDKAVREASILFRRFVDGSNGTDDVYTFQSHTEISKILSQDIGFVNMTKKFESNALVYFNQHGNLEGFDGAKFIDKPYISQTFFMHTIMGGTHQIDATIKSISANEIKVDYTVWDHFGAGVDDAIPRAGRFCA